MRDIVENRKKLNLSQKMNVLWLVVRENGVVWAALTSLYLVFSSIANFFFVRLAKLRFKNNLPGLNSVPLNKVIWESWDWSDLGEEWTVSEIWKTALIGKALAPHLNSDASALEIGPGAGQWSEHIIPNVACYTGVDISADCVKICQDRFKDSRAAKFFVTNGTDLSMVPDDSIDFTWSFDVFVHINAKDVSAYLQELKRVCKQDAILVLHHGAVAGEQGGWRSNLTGPEFKRISDECGLKLVETFDSWTFEERFHELSYGDAITVLQNAN